VATSLPLFVEVWCERSLPIALIRFVKQMCTLSPLMFIFQGKVIGYYVVNELRYGGATYVSTGRGLPTERRPFIGEAEESGLKLKRVGGLYLDYAFIAYYDGVKLLAGVALIVMAGGVHDASSHAKMLSWVFLSLGLVIISWLLAPFIFNPYQFQLSGFLRDLRCTAAFFLEDSGRHWVEWYDRTQLRRGSGRSAVDIAFFIGAFLIVAWYAMMTVKIAAFNRIYFADFKNQLDFVGLVDSALSGSFPGVSLNTLVLVPPLACSFAYCMFVSLLEACVGAYGAVRRYRLRRRQSAEEDLDESVAHSREKDRAVQPAPEVDDVESGSESRRCCCSMPKKTSCCCCTFGLPLALSALVVVILDLAEAFFALHRLYLAGWWNTFLAAFVLKWGIIGLLLVLGEGWLRMRWGRLGCAWAPLDLWVRAHRIARDMAASSLILVLLLPFVVLNKLNDCLCPGLSLHHLLMYRNPNHLMKREVDLDV